MEEKIRIQINHDEKADEIEIKKRPSGDFSVVVPQGTDLEKDKRAQEDFAEKFNMAYREHNYEAENILDPQHDRLNRVELGRLNDAIRKGEDKYNFRIPEKN